MFDVQREIEVNVVRIIEVADQAVAGLPEGPLRQAELHIVKLLTILVISKTQLN